MTETETLNQKELIQNMVSMLRDDTSCLDQKLIDVPDYKKICYEWAVEVLEYDAFNSKSTDLTDAYSTEFIKECIEEAAEEFAKLDK